MITGIMVTLTPIFSQMASLSDSSTSFRNASGRILATEEVMELANQAFSLQQDLADGKKLITILPSAVDDTTGRNELPENFKRNLINKPLAPFRLRGLYYQVWDSKQLEGRVLVMNFWSTSCTPCIREMPLLNELVATYKYKNVIFLAHAPENPFRIKKFLKKNSFNYNIIPAAQKYIDMLQIENFPTHLVIDKNGIIRHVFGGNTENIKEKLQPAIEKLLKERW